MKMQTKLNVEGMSCQHCVKAVTDALTELGASKVDVNLEAKTVLVDHEDKITEAQIKEAIEDAGYDVV